MMVEEKRVFKTKHAYLNRKVNSLRSLRLKEGTDFDLELDQVLRMWDLQEGCCAISGIQLTHLQDGTGAYRPFNASIDRVDPKASYCFSNVQLVTVAVNQMKAAMPEDMFTWWIKTIYNYYCR
jgi:hypothetical protein